MQILSHTVTAPGNKSVRRTGVLFFVLISIFFSQSQAENHPSLKVITSADPDSNKNHSFVYVENGASIPQGIKKESIASELKLQIPFVIDLPVALKNGESITWQVKTISAYSGSIEVLSKYSVKKTKFKKGFRWQTKTMQSDIADRSRLVFRPKPVKHKPAIYKKGRGGNGKRRLYGGGTRKINDKFFNPRLSYQVVAAVKSADAVTKKYTAIIEMDNKDMVRQEYILHYGINRYGRGKYGNLPVPYRSEITRIPDMPSHLLGNALSESRYGLMIDDGLTELAVMIVNLYEQAKNEYKSSSKQLRDLKGRILPVPKSELWLSGGWRNPERNEWFSNALNGIHQRGGAIDIVANEPHDDIRSAIVYWFLWKILSEQKTQEAFWQLETGGRPMITREFKEDIEPENGIPDAFDKADHIHINIKYD